MTRSQALAHAVRVLILTIKLDPAFTMSTPSLVVWRELELALATYEEEQKP